MFAISLTQVPLNHFLECIKIKTYEILKSHNFYLILKEGFVLIIFNFLGFEVIGK